MAHKFNQKVIHKGDVRFAGEVELHGEIPVKLKPLTVATIPAASADNVGAVAYVSNGAAGNPILAFSSGTSWLRCDTGEAISDGS